MKAAIDLRHLEQYVFGDRSLLDEILTIFIDQASQWIDRMDPALPDDQWHLAAHTLKGAARGVGAWALGDVAERAEALLGPDQASSRCALQSDLKAIARETIAHAVAIRDRAA